MQNSPFPLIVILSVAKNLNVLNRFRSFTDVQDDKNSYFARASKGKSSFLDGGRPSFN